MAAVHLHNVIFNPLSGDPSDSEGRSHIPDRSSGSITSGNTASDVTPGRQFGGNTSNSQLLEINRRPVASNTGTQLQFQYSYTQQEFKWTHEMRTRTMRIWSYARLGLTTAVLCWVVYCTFRYFIAVRIHRRDHVRSRYALGMGITSVFTIVFFASETFITLWFYNNHFYRRLRIIVHALAYLSSALVLGLSIINLVLVNVWRMPQNPAQRSIQGRCHWDLDVVWGGTGMSCAEGGAKPFGDWLGAAIFRLVISAVLMIAYHLVMHGYPPDRYAQQTPGTVDANMGELNDRRPSIPSTRTLLPSSHIYDPSSVPLAITVSEDEHQRRSLSFTAAGQVLSRIDDNELDHEDDQASSTSSISDQNQRPDEPDHSHRFNSDTSPPSQMSHSPERLSSADSLSASLPLDMSSYLPQPSLDPYAESEEVWNAPPSSYLRTIATPSSDLQDFASAFRNFVSHFTQETQEGMTLDDSRPTVRVLGSYISRMSTIDSMASREAGSPVRSPSRSDTNLSNGSGSRNLSRDPTLSNRDRDELLAVSPPVLSEGHSSS